ncbi:Transcriptional regulatory protein [Bosea sp. LC85]|uniref:LysR substrate-binding domain-containing protein n=1 Tax=Bosea sp. LC85 TaxID=1502851 RepID=UPI0004E3AFD6|nr:LysR substrate-binding domain-containing protein [Bosea sp. LC85]KFC70062.1 Transcriptional regulatory protein [Bosea sp. LC85]
MHLQSRQIEAFRAVMMTGSMTAAAEVLGVTQPAVSRLIRDFEAVLGMSLFERRGYQLVPTPDALTLYGEVERSFIGQTRIAELAKALKANAAGALRIAAMPVLMGGPLPRFVARFSREHADLRVTLVGLSSRLVVEHVLAGQADIGYADLPLDPTAIEVETYPIAAVAALPSEHRLAPKTVLEPADFAGEHVIGAPPGSLFRSRVDAFLDGVAYHNFINATLAQATCTMVSENAGIAIVSPHATENYQGRGLVTRPLSVRIEAGFACLRAKQRAASALASSFTDAFARYLRRWSS